MLYKLRTITPPLDKKSYKNAETMLKQLLPLIPTLRKHKLDEEVTEKVRKLRSGRKARSFTLEMSRKYRGQELTATKALTRSSDKIETMRLLKQEIQKKIRDARAAEKPPVEQFTFRQGVTVPKLAEVYLEPGAFAAVFKKKIRADMVRSKKPSTKDNYIGVEIELASTKDRDFICDKLCDAGMAKYITIKDDGSIKRDEVYRHTHEICILVRQHEYESVVNRICSVLNAECDVRVDKSCGLHVHLDMRNRSPDLAFNNLVQSQQFLYAMLPANRRTSRYSYPIKGTEWRVSEDRYHGINTQAYSKFNTIEARMHCGTTQGSKINNWIKLLLSICDAPKMHIAPVSIASLKVLASLSPDLVAYVEARIHKFKEQHSKAVITSEAPNTMPNIDELVGTPAVDESVVEASEVA